MKKASKFELLMGLAGIYLLKWSGNMADKRGDAHEAKHCYQAVLIANSHHEHLRCQLDVVDRATHDAWKFDIATSLKRG